MSWFICTAAVLCCVGWCRRCRRCRHGVELECSLRRLVLDGVDAAFPFRVRSFDGVGDAFFIA